MLERYMSSRTRCRTTKKNMTIGCIYLDVVLSICLCPSHKNTIMKFNKNALILSNLLMEIKFLQIDRRRKTCDNLNVDVVVLVMLLLPRCIIGKYVQSPKCSWFDPSSLIAGFPKQTIISHDCY